MNSKFTTRLQAMTSLLGGVYYGFGDDGVFLYNFISELVANVVGYVLIGTGGMIRVFVVGLFLVGTVNATIIFFVRIGKGLMSFISYIFEVF